MAAEGGNGAPPGAAGRAEVYPSPEELSSRGTHENAQGSNYFHSSGALVPVGKQKKSRLLQEVFWVFGSLL